MFFSFCAFAQQDTSKPAYNPKEEVLYDGKRYRVHNNWLSFGGGWAVNTHREKDQKVLALDYNFHIKTHQFQAGAFMSGNNFTPGNNYNFHIGYGLRQEKIKYNFAAFGGISTSYFYRPLEDSVNHNVSRLYNELGGYVCVQLVYKIKYDVGAGLEVFADYNQVQSIVGARIILYFSGAYRGPYRGGKIRKIS